MTSTPLVAWAVAPEWVTLHQAAELMGLSYTAQDIEALIVDGAIEAEEIGGAWLVWQGVRDHKGWIWIGAGVIALGIYGFVATLQPDAHFGRILAPDGPGRWRQT